MFKPRQWQHDVDQKRKKRTVLVVHRRAGKTIYSVNLLIREAMKKDGGNYAYIAPLYNQAKDIAWAALKEALDPVPSSYYKFNESELHVTFSNGSRIKLYGSDNPDSLRGRGFDGVVVDEVADMPPNTWQYVIMPTVSDKGRDAWVLFIGTPKGHDQFHTLYTQSLDVSFRDWYGVKLDVDVTAIFNAKEKARFRKEMGNDAYEQEYMCSFDAAIVGAYYSTHIARIREAGKIGSFVYDPTYPVHTAWDIGLRDATAVWWFQVVGNQIRLIEYQEETGLGLPEWVGIIKEKPYLYGTHLAPHDMKVTEWGSNTSRLQTARKLGIHFTVCPKKSIQDGISAVRQIIPRCAFNIDATNAGLEALIHYKSDYDEKKGVLRPKPIHDWTSHGADAFRYLATGLYLVRNEINAFGIVNDNSTRADSDYDELAF